MRSTTRAFGVVAVLVLASSAVAAEDFSGKDLRMRDFTNANLEGANFEDANLFLARFNNSVFSKANFKDADLTSASFNHAKGAGANFRSAIFKNVSMQDADLTGAIFEGTDLGNISFQSSKLRSANLRGCKGIGDSQKADMREADLRGAVFTCSVYYMTGCRLTGAKYDKNTRWPDGFDVSGSGAVLTESNAEGDPKLQPTDGNKATSAVPPPRAGRQGAGVRKAPALDGQALSEEVIKYLLETQMWGSKDGRGFTYNYKSLTIAEPRKGDALIDIARGDKARIVTPVRVRADVIKDQGNNNTTTTEKHQDYVFFKDEFGQWSYRFVENR